MDAHMEYWEDYMSLEFDNPYDQFTDEFESDEPDEFAEFYN